RREGDALVETERFGVSLADGQGFVLTFQPQGAFATADWNPSVQRIFAVGRTRSLGERVAITTDERLQVQRRSEWLTLERAPQDDFSLCSEPCVRVLSEPGMPRRIQILTDRLGTFQLYHEAL
ncbi:MAG: hypothetical protein AAFY60_22030, partial [Myxococcota bacterium]